MSGHQLVGSFDELAVGEGRSGSDEGDEMGRVDHAPAGLGGFDELERPGAKKALAEIWNAEDKDHARAAAKAFEAAYGVKFPRAAPKITSDLELRLVPRKA
jgi:hypothetical protein